MNGFKQAFRGKAAFSAVLMVLLTAVVISVVTAVYIGSANISVSDILGVVSAKLFGAGDLARYGAGPVSDIIWFIRLPRLLLAVAVGMALSVCGVVMQAIVKNPLADPYVLGISSGASMGATLAILAGVGKAFGSGFVGVMGCAGAFGISLAVIVLSGVGGRSNSVKLLLAGMALSAVCSAISSFVTYFYGNRDGMMTVTYWLMGSLAGAKWEVLSVLMPFVILGTLFFWSQSRTLDMMLLGDEVSITLGTDLHKYRVFYLLAASAMVGLVVYASGIIGFVGLVIPHVVRMGFGVQHKRLLPVSALLGAILLIWSDVLCRVVVPRAELPIGILTSLIGAPCFVYLMAKKKYGFGGGR